MRWQLGNAVREFPGFRAWDFWWWRHSLYCGLGDMYVETSTLHEPSCESSSSGLHEGTQCGGSGIEL